MEESRIRKTENLHIYLWLIKDFCWAAGWAYMAQSMIVPTLSVAIWILFKGIPTRTEFIHNLAVFMWISANAIWMIAEFNQLESTLKPYALILFVTGIIIISGYHIINQFKKKFL